MEIISSSDFVADAVARVSAAAVEARGGPFRLSLCGGGTPRAIYEALAEEQLPWGQFVITFGDERCVPPNDADSNFRMAREALLDHVPIPEENIVRIKGEMDPGDAASDCEEELRRRSPDGVFVHDLVLLGMGEDGHTASLFPGTTALSETERWVVANEVPQQATTRITMTYPLINAARRVLFLVAGEAKRKVVDEVVAGADYPATRVSPAGGELVWLVGR